jgi:transcriptional regulator with XRE-family HTH domain
MDTLAIRMAVAVETAIAEAGQTHLGVSEATGIPRTTLLRRLKGQSSFAVDELERIAEVIGVPVSQILAKAEAAA